MSYGEAATKGGQAVALFDLNIEEVLDHWDVEHGIREIIANALDEQLLTASPDVKISKALTVHGTSATMGAA